MRCHDELVDRTRDVPVRARPIALASSAWCASVIAATASSARADHSQWWITPTATTRFTSAALSSGPMAPIGASFQQAPFGAGDERSGAAASSTTGVSWGKASGESTAGGASADGSAPGAGAGAAPSEASGSAAVRFGARGTLQFNVFGDYANDLDETSMAGLQLGVSWFFVENLSLDLQLEQYGVFQDGGDAYAIGPALLFRWHFLAEERWSIYTDFGCGFIVATESVPNDGSRFNFTPRLGVGASFEIAPRARVMTGVRWFHISNANTSSPNPGLDSVELYAGLSLPF